MCKSKLTAIVYVCCAFLVMAPLRDVSSLACVGGGVVVANGQHVPAGLVALIDSFVSGVTVVTDPYAAGGPVTDMCKLKQAMAAARRSLLGGANAPVINTRGRWHGLVRS